MALDEVSAALTHEHHVVDTAVTEFVAGLDRGQVRSESLLEAIQLLRRHIYIEEALLFPPIRQAGMLMPILVMLREHGELWRTMDTLTELLTGPENSEELMAVCRLLMGQLEQHNLKEEPIVYPQAGIDLTPEASAELLLFLQDGHTPDGWVCQHALA